MRIPAIALWLLAGLASGAALADPVATPADVAQALRAGNPVLAEEEATQALAVETISPDDRVHLLLNRALARDALGKRQDALSDLNNAIWMDLLPPDEKARALFDRGVTLDELGRTQDALNDYSAALELKPDYAAALNDRANAERRLGRLADAKADYEAALAAGDPDKKYSYFGLGEVAAAMGDRTEAAIEYRAALAQDANYAIAAERLAALGNVPPPLNLHPPQGSAAAPALRSAEADNTAAPVAQADSGGIMLQLGAYATQASAQSDWHVIMRRARGALDAVSPHIYAADIPGKGRLWRLRVGPLARQDGMALCRRLQSQGNGCWPIRD